MDKNGNITITSEDFYNGVSRSPYLGIQQMVNLDIHSKPGSLKIARALEADDTSSVTLNDKLRFGGIEQATGDFYGLDQDGNLLQRSDSTGSWSDENDFGTTNDGAFVWKNYVIVLRSGVSAILEAYGPLVGGTSAKKSFTSLSFSHSSNATFITYIDLDDRVYIGADNVTHELVQVDGKDFDPTDGTTYSLSEEVLILPEGINIEGIDEIGTNIVVATSYGSNQTVADLFVWNPNKSGTDANAPDQRIPLGGAGVRQIGYIDNLIYCLTGLEGSFKRTDLTSVDKMFEFNNLLNDSDTDLTYTLKGQSTESHNGGLIFGLSKDGAAEPNIAFFKDSRLTFFTTSEGQVAGGIRIGKVQSLDNDTLLVGWENVGDGTFGVDTTGSNRYSGYSAYFISQLYNVGQHLREKTYQYVGFTLGRALQSGEGIRIKYRKGLGESFTTLGTWDYSTYGAITAYEDNANLPTDLTNLQLQVEMTTSGTTTPELTSIYVI